MCPKGNVLVTQSSTVRAAVYPFHSSAYDWLVLTASGCDLLQRATSHCILHIYIPSLSPPKHPTLTPCILRTPNAFVLLTFHPTAREKRLPVHPPASRAENLPLLNEFHRLRKLPTDSHCILTGWQYWGQLQTDMGNPIFKQFLDLSHELRLPFY